MLFRIAVVGDTHFGFAHGTERSEDCYEQARRAFIAAIEEKPDVIVLTGDVFDTPIPRQETLARAAQVLSAAARAPESQARLLEPQQAHAPIKGIPIVAIHGTHERRIKGLTNPLHVLSNAGTILYLQNSTFVFEKDGALLAFSGFGGVPEAHALVALKEVVNPKPRSGARNVLLFHQSVRPFVFTKEREGFTIEDLPAGFDLYVDGHIHWGFVEKHPCGAPILFSGSTIVTQVRKNEAGVDKSVWIIDIPVSGQAEIRKKDFPSIRRVVLLEVESCAKAAEELRRMPAGDAKPLVRVKLPAGEESFPLQAEFSNRMLLHVDASKPEEEPKGPGRGAAEGEIPEKAQESLEQRAMKILSELIPGAPQNLEEIYSLLLQGKVAEASDAILGNGEAAKKE